ncbi:uncharacterized protein LOC101736312 isoform X1 [Bombyx mori]|uniref:uncharacterized protein LOC101736312 isoform X1 n=1 Tax=Bombyx mori TaxID=7091 RepID=UPI002ED0CAD4
MEVAGQWRKEWAGAAEYGKVTEGGVTRQIARAMEVLNATGPGARVRVMRASYHSSAGPGIPASSYMMHSSRRVISSGYNFTDPPSIPSIPAIPLEISSTPLELSHDSQVEPDTYKVTEPDDLEISEPSKWRGSRGTGSIRMPSEESSSTDNASIIDLDPKNSRHLHRKYSYDSESSDIQWNKKTASRVSPLLDAPVTLNTLKYKSLLNNSSDWNNRRKSYSFEDTKISLDEVKVHSIDTFAMDSSTDSGICKSTEIVNDHVEESTHSRPFERKNIQNNSHDECFKDWLAKNRSNNYYKGNKFKPSWEHDVVIEDPVESNIVLQSTGKISITLPTKIETYDEASLFNKTEKCSEDHQRKVKKVEFCKTELHFAAESGKVNIIATDDKPPPSNDFRKRRSVFVPIEMVDKPITLFGEKTTVISNQEKLEDILRSSISDYVETDENTAATKSILKNKIPKPKPYLLGENMAFGSANDETNESINSEPATVLKAVSLINKQLQPQGIYDDLINSTDSSKNSKPSQSKKNWTANEGPTINKNHVFATEPISHQIKTPLKEVEKLNKTDLLRTKFESAHSPSNDHRTKARQLRESDLTYFGVNKGRKEDTESKIFKSNLSEDSAIEDIFQSVRLIQQVSNSVCNSEAESDDVPEYQNFHATNNYIPVPKPRLRTRYEDKPNEIHEVKVLKPIIEHERSETNDYVKSITRRSKSRRQEHTASANRSLSEPPKRDKAFSNSKQSLRANTPSRSVNRTVREAVESQVTIATPRSKKIEEMIPIYENLHPGRESNIIYDKNKLKPKTSITPEVPTRKTYVKRQEKSEDVKTSKLSNNDRNTKSSSQNTNGIGSLRRISQITNKRSETREPHKGENVSKMENEKDLEAAHKTSFKSVRQVSTPRRSKVENRTSSSPCRPDRNETKKTLDDNCKKESQPVMKKSAGYDKNKKSSKDTSKESDPLKKMDQNTIVYEMKSVQIKNEHKDINSKRNRSKSPRRREYVINYDDKNGTVSSVCKVTTSPGGSYRKKKISKEILDSPKGQILKPKTINKIALRK